MKKLGLEGWGIGNARFDTTPKVFNGWWQGRFSKHSAMPMVTCMSATLTGMVISGIGTTTGLATTSTPATRLRWQLSSFLLYYLVGEFCFVSWPFQPPSIRPISLSLSDKAKYFLLSSDLVSHGIKRNTLIVSVFLIAILMTSCFSSRTRKEELEMASIVSDSRLSTFWPSV